MSYHHNGSFSGGCGGGNGGCGCGCQGAAGMGAYYMISPYEGMGAVAPPGPGPSGGTGGGGIRQTFNAEAVWADASLAGSIGAIIQAGKDLGCTSGHYVGGDAPEQEAACQANWQLQGRANTAGQRALKNIAEALNELGYGPAATGGGYEEPTRREAWGKYVTEKGLPPSFVNKIVLQAMERDLKGGTSKATAGGLGPLGWLLLLLAGGAATVAVVSGKKKSPGPASPAPRVPTH